MHRENIVSRDQHNTLGVKPDRLPVANDEYENWVGLAYHLLGKRPSMDEALDFLETFETALATSTRTGDEKRLFLSPSGY